MGRCALDPKRANKEGGMNVPAVAHTTVMVCLSCGSKSAPLALCVSWERGGAGGVKGS